MLHEHHYGKIDGSETYVQKISPPVELFLPKIWYSNSKQVPNPLPVSELSEVIASIRRTKMK